VTHTTRALALLFFLPLQAEAKEDCAAVNQVVAMTATGFAAVRGDATKFTGREVWRSRVTLPHTGACIVDPRGGYSGSLASFDCFSVVAAALGSLLAACFPGAQPHDMEGARDGNALAYTLELGGVTIALDGVGRTLRILSD